MRHKPSPFSQIEVAEILGLSRRQVQIIEYIALKKLRAVLSDANPNIEAANPPVIGMRRRQDHLA